MAEVLNRCSLERASAIEVRTQPVGNARLDSNSNTDRRNCDSRQGDDGLGNGLQVVPDVSQRLGVLPDRFNVAQQITCGALQGLERATARFDRQVLDSIADRVTDALPGIQILLGRNAQSAAGLLGEQICQTPLFLGLLDLLLCQTENHAQDGALDVQPG